MFVGNKARVSEDLLTPSDVESDGFHDIRQACECKRYMAQKDFENLFFGDAERRDSYLSK